MRCSYSCINSWVQCECIQWAGLLKHILLLADSFTSNTGHIQHIWGDLALLSLQSLHAVNTLVHLSIPLFCNFFPFWLSTRKLAFCEPFRHGIKLKLPSGCGYKNSSSIIPGVHTRDGTSGLGSPSSVYFSSKRQGAEWKGRGLWPWMLAYLVLAALL